jgi:hypothetical protein
MIGELVLARDPQGQVFIEKMGYYPCAVVNFARDDINYSTVPTAQRFADDPSTNEKLKEAEKTVVKVLGKKVTQLDPPGLPLVGLG